MKRPIIKKTAKLSPFTEEEKAKAIGKIEEHILTHENKSSFYRFASYDLPQAISHVRGSGFGSSNDFSVFFKDDHILVTLDNRKDLILSYEDLQVQSVLTLRSENSHGVYEEVGKKRNGKPKLEPKLENCEIIREEMGTRYTYPVSTSLLPLYQEYTFDDYMEDVRAGNLKYIDPMLAKEDKDYLKKEEHRVSEISEEKKDGHRAIMQIQEKNRFFSRNTSKITGWLGENTDNLPHLRDLEFPSLKGTILDGEITSGKDSMSVQSILGALPERAIQYQSENDFARFYVWDILYYRGVNIQALPMWKRKVFLSKAIREMQSDSGMNHIDFIPMYMTEEAERNFLDLLIDYPSSSRNDENFIKSRIKRTEGYVSLFKESLEEGKEGIIVKDIDGRYEQKRSPLYTKLKEVSTWDCIIMGLEESEKEYSGKLIEEGRLEDWNYWYHPESDSFVYLNDSYSLERKESIMEQCNPVTKPYFHGWCGGITLGVWKDGEVVKVGECKGLTEEIQEDLKHNGEKYIAEKRVLEVLAQEVINKDTGSLRHPRFSRFRIDKSHEECVWEEHIK